MHGRVDAASLGKCLRRVGVCLSEAGKYEEARGWFERAVEEAKKGDVFGRVDEKVVAVCQRSLDECRKRIAGTA